MTVGEKANQQMVDHPLTDHQFSDLVAEGFDSAARGGDAVGQGLYVRMALLGWGDGEVE